MSEKRYSYKLPLGVIVVILFLAIAVDGVLIYLAQTNTHPWRIEGIYFSVASAKIFFWIVAVAAFWFFAIMLFIGLFSYLTGNILLCPDRIIAPKGEFSVSTVKIPYGTIKFLQVSSKVIKDRKVRTLNIFHDGGKTYITEGLLSSSATFDEIYAQLYRSISPLAQQFTAKVEQQKSSMPR